MLPPLIHASGNGKIQPGGQGYLTLRNSPRFWNSSGNVPALNVTSPMGNPHYCWIPDNGRRIAKESPPNSALWTGRPGLLPAARADFEEAACGS